MAGPVLPDKVRYCERFLELIIDLEALLPTRRFFNTVMDDNHLVVRCQLSNLLHRPEGSLFGQVSRQNVLNNLIQDFDLNSFIESNIFLIQKSNFIYTYYIDINTKNIKSIRLRLSDT